ncbi:TetR family transcriptional regulator [Pseudomonas segetis]|uniref:Transcriptional regulator, TetR family n=1 Tax=Pseudomonas segetis TaxID=298908 RepID=A0A239GTK1_9PSED|nr:TetR/AcrR family transcriptional regulator [Pseudomonas segetis]SNS72162.1 transcriptional regulator, TetR family [Pseudomonas segetis]
MSRIVKKANTQARGRLRRQQLIAATRRLLASFELDQITLADVAAEAGASKGSAYHSYANIAELYMDVVGVIGQELFAAVAAPIEEDLDDWRDIFVLCLRRGTALLVSDPAARQLIHGPKSPPAIKRSDRANDLQAAQVILGHLHKLAHIETSSLTAETLYFAIEIADVLYCLSVQQHGEIIEQMAREGERAAIAYLELYLPS